ncbi:Putative hydrolase [Galdieria sulphuraria]|nr:Putative hydrolase [Galdieria sulphuraria]
MANPVIEEIIFLGSGTSEGVPRVSCLTESPVTCKTCKDAVLAGSKNRRRNCSLLLRAHNRQAGSKTHVVIDVGKFFYESALAWFPKYHLRNIDAVLLTHDHADHVNGLDDLRDFTLHMRDNCCPLPVYCDDQTFRRVEASFPYLVDPSKGTGSGVTARLVFCHIDPLQEFQVLGIRFIPLPVWHGPQNSALGFRFGSVSYIPDVSAIPDTTLEKMKGSEYLIIDSLFPGKEIKHISHFCESQALEIAKQIQPKFVYLTDFTHLWFHDFDEQRLRQEYQESFDIHMAYDGLRVQLETSIS